MTSRRLPLFVALLALALPASADARTHHRHARTHHRHAHTHHRHSHHARAHHARAQHARAHAAVECPNADLVPAPGNLAAVRAAILCLHNQIRAAHGLRTLGFDARLSRAAAGHSSDMVTARYFEHTAPSGATMVARIRRTGYLRPNRAWTVGENLEWGTGSLATPRGAMDAWMHSAGHRANILQPGYAEMGVGVSLGTPTPAGRPGATYTVDFGAIG